MRVQVDDAGAELEEEGLDFGGEEGLGHVFEDGLEIVFEKFEDDKDAVG